MNVVDSETGATELLWGVREEQLRPDPLFFRSASFAIDDDNQDDGDDAINSVAMSPQTPSIRTAARLRRPRPEARLTLCRIEDGAML